MQTQAKLAPLPPLDPLTSYLVDAFQRSVLYWDVMRERGNQYFAHMAETAPNVLQFQFEVVVDGRTLANSGLADGERTAILLPAGPRGPAFIVTRNFDVIYGYNAAESYALAIARSTGQPVSLANAFLKPARPSGEDDLVDASIRKLEAYLGRLKEVVGEAGTTSWLDRDPLPADSSTSFLIARAGSLASFYADAVHLATDGVV